MSGFEELAPSYSVAPGVVIEFVGGPVDGQRATVPESALAGGWNVPVPVSFNWFETVDPAAPPRRSYEVAHYRPLADASTQWLPQRLDDGTVRFRFWGLS